MNKKIKTVILSANENFYGCSPKVLKALNPNLKQISKYPDAPDKLKEKIAEKYHTIPGRIIVGAGCVRIIESLIRTFVNNDEEVLIFENSFIAYSQLCAFYGKRCVYAKLDNGKCNPKNLLPLINSKTKLVFIANPNNPTGTIISHKELEDFLSKISSKIVVALDEAYSEYVCDNSFPDSLKLQEKYKNLVTLHSFSKIYGLAGLRIGFGIADEELIDKMMATQLPFTLNTFAIDAAITAIDDEDFIRKSKENNSRNLAYLSKKLMNLGFNLYPSHSNFIFLWFDKAEQKDNFYNILLNNNIVVCDMKVFGQAKSIRITIGDMRVSKNIIKLLGDLYSGQATPLPVNYPPL